MDPEVRRKILRIPDYDLVLVGSRAARVEDPARDLNAFLGSWWTQSSFEPPLLTIAVRKDSSTNAMIRESRVFSMNMLSAGQKEVAKAFLKGAPAKDGRMGPLEYRTGRTGTPLFPATAGWVECEVRHEWDGGDHTIFVGEVVEAEAGQAPADPLTTKGVGWTYAG